MSATKPPSGTGFDMGTVVLAPTKDPKWIVRCGAMGLLALVPLAGSLNLLGWQCAIVARRVRGGDDADVLPPAGFHYIGAGWRLFLARVPLVAMSVLFLAFGLGAGAGLMHIGGQFKSAGLLVAVGTYLGMFVGILLFTVLTPAIDFLHIVDGDAWASLAFGRQRETVRAGGLNYALLLVAVLVAGAIAQLGMLACFVGLFVSVPLSVAVQAAALAEYARVLAERPVAGPPSVRIGGVGSGDGSPVGVGGA